MSLRKRRKIDDPISIPYNYDGCSGAPNDLCAVFFLIFLLEHYKQVVVYEHLLSENPIRGHFSADVPAGGSGDAFSAFHHATTAGAF